METRKKWNREELLIALNLYHKLPFGKLHSRQPAIVALAERMDRGANSLAMKLCNFASLDPALKLRGIKGLDGASALDRAVWAEFHDDLNESVPATEEAFRNLIGVSPNDEIEVSPEEGLVVKPPPEGPTEIITSIKVRRGQQFFREAVVNNSGGACNVSGLAIRELLVASHILPWGSHPEHRLDVQNGLCLSRLHDAAFDRGLIAFDENLKLLLSPQLESKLDQRSVAENFGAYAGQPLQFPSDAALPNPDFLWEHRMNIFRAA
jgi:putative restriction endonuclease